ncbi:MAG: ParB N-terminal domain-containing protein [Clostridia bacterium]|nr:ParB N-terminal domain-containing protein [Clostridia bacterium]
MKAVKVKLSDLKLDPENVRHHGAENINMLKKSLQENTQYRPLIVDEKSMVVKIGNGRLMAMRELGWEECWCILTDFSGREGMEVLDNRLNELSYWTDKSLDDWLANDKGVEWWGVDSKKFVSLERKARAAEKKESPEPPKKKEILLCPCCGKPLRKVKSVLQ